MDRHVDFGLTCRGVEGFRNAQQIQALRTICSVERKINSGYLFQVLSGDAVIIRGTPKGGPPPERTVCLSNVQAPRLARRANPNVEGSLESKDEV